MALSFIRHTPLPQIKGANQLIDNRQRILLYFFSQLSIALGCFGTGMPQKTLNVAQAETLPKQMCRITVAKRVN